jgi:hypothetical protein
MQVPTLDNPEEATGQYLSGIVGVRISTPIFGTGFNFCVGKHGPAVLTGRSSHSSQADICCIDLESETNS